MLSEVFYWVLNMSVLGTLTLLLILIIRSIKPIPRSIVFFAWIIPFIRFIIPFGLASEFSIINLLDGYLTKTVYLPATSLSSSNSLQFAETYYPITYKNDIMDKFFYYASIVWVVFALLLILIFSFYYYCALKEVGNLPNRKENIYISEAAGTPYVVGIINPKIILPAFLKSGEDFIIIHEKAHIDRRDNLWRVLAVVVCCLHWFNPFVWFFLKKFFADMELACDERVIREIGGENKNEYAKALIGYSEQKSLFLSAFGGADTKSRVKKILSYKKLTVFSAVLSISIIIFTAVVLLTNAV